MKGRLKWIKKVLVITLLTGIHSPSSLLLLLNTWWIFGWKDQRTVDGPGKYNLGTWKKNQKEIEYLNTFRYVIKINERNQWIWKGEGYVEGYGAKGEGRNVIESHSQNQQ